MTSMNNIPGMTKLDAYIKIIDSLEKLNLISTDRSADNYTGWIILPPKRI
jgi:hypothetical protein